MSLFSEIFGPGWSNYDTYRDISGKGDILKHPLFQHVFETSNYTRRNSKVTTKEGGFTVTLEVPGVDPKDISVSVNEYNNLAVAIKGESTWVLTEKVDSSSVQARLSLGILTIEAKELSTLKTPVKNIPISL